MKKRVITTMLIGVLALSNLIEIKASETEMTVEESPIDGFRDFKWGTHKDEIVLKTISDDMIEGEDYGYIGNGDTLVFVNGNVAGYDAFVYYQFNDIWELVNGQYVLTEKHSNENSYYYDYLDIISKYEKKYGKADYYNENWKGDLYKGREDKIGMALATGDLTIVNKWNDDNGASILIIITGDNFDINTSISYFSPDYEEKDNTDGI